MENNFINDLVKVCKFLEHYGVEYLIVGGTAVALHGYFRITTDADGKPNEKHDLDIWYNPTYENYFNLLEALNQLGLDTTQYKEESAPNPKRSYFKFETENFSFDFLPELLSLKKFRDSFRRKEVVDIDGTLIFFVSYEDLINEKKESGRSKDLNDIKQLKIRNPNNTGQTS
jgi:predicted nucleotidyltransferase